jgi:gluconolactonase
MQLEILSPAIHHLIPEDAELERVATGFVFTEGPLWDATTGSLLLSDIPANRIYRWTEGREPEVLREPSGKSNGLTWDPDGRLLACEHTGRRVSRTLDDGSVVPVAESFGGKRLNSPNDLVLRSDGCLYFTDPPYGILSPEVGEIAPQEQPVNGIYLLCPGEAEPQLLAGDFDRPNGLAFSPDESIMYVADTSRYRVHAFDVRADGMLENNRIFARFREEQGAGRPDGMKVDREGNLYTTGPGGLWVVAPDGTQLAQVRFPERTANCAWGGGDWRSLFVTATSSVYRLRTLIPGIAPVTR